ncbi:hypothetical protein FACS1894205_5860 [Alphaproteobacteria bacterium]|nr:hypothetical protein FACS1894205_5860 [Alphaproteobacteria bacterium]
MKGGIAAATSWAISSTLLVISFAEISGSGNRFSAMDTSPAFARKRLTAL